MTHYFDSSLHRKWGSLFFVAFCLFFASGHSFAQDTESAAQAIVFDTIEPAELPVKPARFLEIQEVKSAGGLTAWLVQDSSIPIIAMEFAFLDAGAKQDRRACKASV